MTKLDHLMREGLQLHQGGRLADAEAIYRKVLDKQPSHAAANHLMGLVLLQRGDAAGAVMRLQRAVKMRGNDPEYLGNLGTALNAAGRTDEAIEAFDKALKLQPHNPAVLNNKGMALKASRRHDDATAAYRAAIALLPAEAGFYRNLGNALSEMGDWHGAEAAYREALARRPNFPNALTGLCLSLQALGRKADAVSTAARYAAQYPTEAEYHRALGHANWLAGNPEAAAAAYRAAIAVAPADVEAHRMLGAIVPRQSEDAEVLAIERLLERPDLKDDHRAQLEFALGAAFDDIGDAERSYDHFVRANAIMRRLRPFDLSAAKAQMEHLQDAYANLLDAEVPPLEPPTGPVFIVGLPRSGKSTLEGMLARHPAFFAAGELQAAANMAAALGNSGGAGAGPVLSPSASLEFGRRYLQMAETLAPGQRVLDTMPNNFLLIGALRLALPGARVIHCLRDPREHMVALFQKYFSQLGNEYANDLGDLLAYLPLYRGLMSFWTQRFPGFVHDADMAEIGSAPDRETGRLTTFLGAPADPACARPYISEPRLGRAPATRGTVPLPLLRAIEQLETPGGPGR